MTTRRWLAFTSAVFFVVAVAVLRLVERQIHLEWLREPWVEPYDRDSEPLETV